MSYSSLYPDLYLSVCAWVRACVRACLCVVCVCVCVDALLLCGPCMSLRMSMYTSHNPCTSNYVNIALLISLVLASVIGIPISLYKEYCLSKTSSHSY